MRLNRNEKRSRAVRRFYAGPRPPECSAGQSIIESCLVIFIICLIFAGIFQLSRIYAAREILCHASARAARAKTVGLNRWMVTKVARIAAIPNAGRMLVPDLDTSAMSIAGDIESSRPGDLWMDVISGRIEPPSIQADMEIARIPEYLWSPDQWRARNILDYEDWDTIRISDLTESGAIGSDIVHIRVTQDYPLTVPAHRAFYASTNITLEGNAFLDNHFPVYLQDMNW